MKAKAILGFLMATALVALLLPGAAVARARPASRHSVTPPEVSAEFSLPGSHGYEVTATVENRRQMKLAAVKWGNVIESESYALPLGRKRDAKAIVADLGRFGRVDVRFVLGKIRHEKRPRQCEGPRIVIEHGHFVGKIVFRGEDGSTEVRARRAAGSITHVPSFVCPPAGPQPNAKKLIRRLEALENETKAEESEREEENGEENLAVRLRATARGGRVVLFASKVVEKERHRKGESTNVLSAVATRHRGRITEKIAATELFGSGSTLQIPNRKDPKSEGILQPPAPFSGSATFRRHPKKQPTWTGNLRVGLPGFGQVRLTGPGTHASMCEGLACLLRGLLSQATGTPTGGLFPRPAESGRVELQTIR